MRREGAPICRWLLEDLTVDVMPTSPRALGFTNRWYAELLTAPTEIRFDGDRTLRVAHPAVFIATKFEAFADRGDEPLGDTDIEDIVTVLAYRKDRAGIAVGVSPEIRTYLAQQANQVLQQPHLTEVVSACLPSDRYSQGLVPLVLKALQSLAGLP